MKQYTVMRTEQTFNQVEEIVTYIEKTLSAPDAAGRLLDLLEEIMLSLKAMPKRQPLVREEPWHSEGVRKVVVKNYVVYYWIKESTGEVWIIAVVSQLRNQLDVLNSFEISNDDIQYVAEP